MKISVENQEESAFTYAVRIPGWCQNYELTINGVKPQYHVEKGYAILNRMWKNGDEIILKMDMPVTLVEANPKVREDIGKVAVMRGPLVYCLEEIDNQDQLQELYLEENPVFTETFEKRFAERRGNLKNTGETFIREKLGRRSVVSSVSGKGL